MKTSHLPRRARRNSLGLRWAVVGAYYAFVFSMPFQVLELGRGNSLSTFIGYVFVASTILKPRFCYRRPSFAFWCFAAYLSIYAFSGWWTSFTVSDGDVYFAKYMVPLKTMVQLLVLFWIASNMLRYSKIARGTLFTLALSCIILGTVQAVQAADSLATMPGRETAFGTNPNLIGLILTLGLLALLGLAYGGKKISKTGRIFFWIFSAFLFLSVVRTGSRGAILGLLVGLGVFLTKRGNLSGRIRIAAVIVLSVVFVAVASYSNPAVRARWENTIAFGDTAGREEIFTAAVQMLNERPAFGWGPVYHLTELGYRLGLSHDRDVHNLYLHILTEVGVLGSVPFFLGLLICYRSAFKARKTVHGILPLAILSSVLVAGLSGTPIYNRLLWLVLAYAVASGRPPLVYLRRRVTSSRMRRTPDMALGWQSQRTYLRDRSF
jgi:O-antigen ligase